MSVANGINETMRLFAQRKANNRADENNKARLAFSKEQAAEQRRQFDAQAALDQVKLGQTQAKLDLSASAAQNANAISRDQTTIQNRRLDQIDAAADRDVKLEEEQKAKIAEVDAARNMQSELQIQGYVTSNGLGFAPKFREDVDREDPKALEHLATLVNSSSVIKDGKVSDISRTEDGTFVIEVENSDGTPGVMTEDGSSEPGSKVVRLSAKKVAELADVQYRSMISNFTDVNNLVNQTDLIDARLNKSITQVLNKVPEEYRRQVQAVVSQVMGMPLDKRGPALEELLVDVEGLSSAPEVSQDAPVQGSESETPTEQTKLPLGAVPERPEEFAHLDGLMDGSVTAKGLTEKGKQAVIGRERGRLESQLEALKRGRSSNPRGRGANPAVIRERQEAREAKIAAYEYHLNPPTDKTVEQAIQDADAPAIVKAVETGAFTPTDEQAEAVQRELNAKGVKVLNDIKNVFAPAEQMYIYAVMGARLKPGAERQTIISQLDNVGATGSSTISAGTQRDYISGLNRDLADQSGAALDKSMELLKSVATMTKDENSDAAMKFHLPQVSLMLESGNQYEQQAGAKVLGSLINGALDTLIDNNPDAGYIEQFQTLFRDDASDSTDPTDFKLSRIYPVQDKYGKITHYFRTNAAGAKVGTEVSATLVSDELGGTVGQAVRYAAMNNKRALEEEKARQQGSQ